MLRKDFLIGAAVLFLGISIILSGYLIGDAIKAAGAEGATAAPADCKIMDLSQAAQYLNMTKEEIWGIIRIEKEKLEKEGAFYGNMFPYFTVDNKQYFYKDALDEWVKDVSGNHREYNTAEGWMLQ